MNTDDKPQILRLSWGVLFSLMFAEAAAIGIVVVCVWLVKQPLYASTDGTDDIRRVLNEQNAAWNRGDLEGYMAGYWNSPELSFYSGGDVTKGWQPTHDRYQRRYKGEGKSMGRLTFADIDIKVLGNDVAMARGHWRVELPDGKAPEGLFTLILRRFGKDWRIVHDHTSVAVPEKP
ncbi:MAG: YybH family protein [Gemmataceae bacterium]